MVEYRPVGDDRLEEFRRLLRYAFRPQAGPPGPDEDVDDRVRRMRAFGDRRGLFDGDDLVAVCKHVEFTARLRGTWLPLAGLAAVATPPDRRRRGYVRELLAASLSEYRDRGWPLSALWPFRRSFYAQFGWGTCDRRTTATVDPGALAPAAGDAGEFHPVDGDDHADLRPAYEAWLDGYDLATRRSPEWWRDRIFQSWESPLYGYRWERDGRTRGYLVYDVAEADEGRRLAVHEAAAADHEAYRNLLRFPRNHDSQVRAVRLYGHSHDRLLDLVADHDDLQVEVSAGPMVRVVDVVAALEAVPYPGVEEATVAVAVEDPLADWNDGTFRVEVTDGPATVRATDADPDVHTDVATLSQSLVGYLSAGRARRLGRLRAGSDVAETLDALFPGGDVYLPERF